MPIWYQFFFYMLISTKKNVNDNFQNNRLNTTNLTGELCKIGKNKIDFKVENILNWLIHLSRSNLYNYFTDEAF